MIRSGGPDLSVIIVSYNTRSLTLRCLERLYAATEALDLEVIVVDNASKDGSADAVAEQHPGVTLVRLDDNVGWARAVNRGAALSHAEHMLFLNPDAEPVGDAVGALLTFARSHPEFGLYTGRTLHSDGTDDGYSCLGLPTLWGSVCFATGLSTAFKRHRWANGEMLPGLDRRRTQAVPAVSGTAMLVRRELFLRAHGFEPRFFMYSEDVDLSVRITALGGRPVLYADAAFVHIGGASSSSHGQRSRLLRGRATYYALHWSPARARWGTRLLKTGVAARATAAAGVAAVRRRKGLDWMAVWRERREWAAGWPPVTEARPGAGLTEQAVLAAARR